ncbi:vacuolar ATPase assembly integral membrane protein vma21 [Coemansia sp. RSA 552]|nr:vacuolar ATPase assembly integral membrane protein vma21 [Coemansia sp. RSA 552]
MARSSTKGKGPAGGQDGVRQRKEKATAAAAAAADDDSSAASDTEQLSNAPHIPGNVVTKLVVFSLLLLVLPILAYFVTLNLVFGGSTTPAAITAAVTANIVLAAYVYAAWIEEDDSGGSQARLKTD